MTLERPYFSEVTSTHLRRTNVRVHKFPFLGVNNLMQMNRLDEMPSTGYRLPCVDSDVSAQHSKRRGGVQFLLMLAVLVSGCKTDTAKQIAAPTASVATVTRGNLSSTLTVAGAFQPYQEVELHAKVSGFVRRINVDIGDKVTNGQVLAILEIPELTAQVSSVEADVKRSQAEIVRMQSEIGLADADYAAVHAEYLRLMDAAKERPGLIAQQELDDAQAKDKNALAKVNVAKASTEAATQQLGISHANRERVLALEDYSVIRSPFKGVVTKRYADVGSLIQAGTSSDTQSLPVVKVAQSDLLRLRMPVPEEYVPYINIGSEVGINVKATGKVFPGKIVRFTRELDTSTRTMLVEVDVPNPNLILNSGMYAETTITLQRQNNALIIPAGAVLKNGDHNYVVTVDQNHKVQRSKVTLGITGADQVVILSGLSEGQSVIVSGQNNYDVGQTVRPIPTQISMPQLKGDN
jgi:RND family efflux transporter MFP subunit